MKHIDWKRIKRAIGVVLGILYLMTPIGYLEYLENMRQQKMMDDLHFYYHPNSEDKK